MSFHRISLVVPEPGIAGGSLRGSLELDVTKEVVVDAIDLKLTGATGSSTGLVALAPFELEAEALLPEPITLGPGPHRLPFALPLPLSLAPSYRAPGWQRRFELKASVSLPWRLDHHRSTEVLIQAPAPAEWAASVVTSNSRPRGELGVERGYGLVEMSVDSDAAHAGEQVEGQVAVVVDSPPFIEALEVQFCERVFVASRGWDTTRSVPAAYFEAEKLFAGAPLGFRVRLPHDLSPSFQTADEQLIHEIVARLVLRHDGGSPAARAAIRVFPASTELQLRARRRPLLGRPREVAALREVADVCGARVEDDNLALDEGAVRVVVFPRLGIRNPLRFCAELSYPPLDLGLVIHRSSPLRWAELRGKEGPLPDGFRGRDPAQVRAFLRPLRSHLIPLASIQASDERLRLEDPGGDGKGRLESFVRRMRELAQAWGEAMQKMPPPTVLTPALPAWRSLAAELGGELRVALLRIDAAFGEHAVSIAPRLGDEGELFGTLVTMQPSMPLDLPSASLTARERSLELPPAAHRPLEKLLGPLSRLDLGPDGLRYMTERPVGTLEEALGWLQAMAELLEALRDRGSPYR